MDIVELKEGVHALLEITLDEVLWVKEWVTNPFAKVVEVQPSNFFSVQSSENLLSPESLSHLNWYAHMKEHFEVLSGQRIGSRPIRKILEHHMQKFDLIVLY